MAREGCRTESFSSFRVRSACMCLPGVVLPVNPSTLLVWKDLQKFDPSDTRQEAVSNPSGLCAPELSRLLLGQEGLDPFDGKRARPRAWFSRRTTISPSRLAI